MAVYRKLSMRRIAAKHAIECQVRAGLSREMATLDASIDTMKMAFEDMGKVIVDVGVRMQAAMHEIVVNVKVGK